jgi:hypothetical protein
MYTIYMRVYMYVCRCICVCRYMYVDTDIDTDIGVDIYVYHTYTSKIVTTLPDSFISIDTYTNTLVSPRIDDGLN